jgi:pyruvate formate lyase activating enzyme
MTATGEKEAAHYQKLAERRTECLLCPRHCVIEPSRRGDCRARWNDGGTLHALSYGRMVAIAVDPMEKKPLYHYYPGTPILSVGSWGCNLHCQFCQNHAISQTERDARRVDPGELVRLAREGGSTGIAYTYNEPVVMFEFVMDCARAFRAQGLKNILVTNGFLEPKPWDELLSVVDAANVDIKGYEESFYRRLCKGELAPVLANVRRAAERVHLETTTLIIPGENDHPKVLDDLAKWLAGECGPGTPAHLSAYFPRYRMTRDATPRETLVKARDIFRKHLWHVYLGNTPTEEEAETCCHQCGTVLVQRRVFEAKVVGLRPDGRCAACGADNGFIV